MLKRYAKKLGLNDRGCYLAIGLAIITFFLLVIIVAMAISWPGESRPMTRLYSFKNDGPSVVQAIFVRMMAM
jgi:hypothetical protein